MIGNVDYILWKGKEITMKKKHLKSIVFVIITSIMVSNQFSMTSYAAYQNNIIQQMTITDENTPTPESITTETPTEAPEPTPTLTPTQTPEPSLVHVELKASPKKLIYMLGEKLDLEGLILEASYEDGKIKEVQPTSVSEIKQTLGKQEITVTFEDYEFKISITVTPAKVTNISLSSNGTKTITLEWKKANGAEQYEIYQYDTKTKKTVLIGTTEGLSWSITSLTSATQYQFQIKSIATITDETGETITLESELSDEFTAYTRPGTTQNLIEENQTDTTITLNWSKVTRAEGYHIYRYNATKKEYQLIGTTSSLTYTDRNLSSGTIYKYRVKAYVGTTDNTGGYSSLLTTGTVPAKTTIKSIKAGTKKVRIIWNKVSGANGYYIYYSTKENGEYEKGATIAGGSKTSYELVKLKNNTTYYFKISAYKNIGSVAKEGALSSAKEKQVIAAKKTSTKAISYRTWTQFKKSTAYKKYTIFRKSLVAKRTFVIPGLTNTNVGGFTSTSMCPQAICIAKDYMLLSAYDTAYEENSVIYVMDKQTRKYLTTIILPNKPHAGGLAYDGTYVWVSNGKKVGAISYATIEAAAKAKSTYKNVSYIATCAVLTQASFMTYYDGKLWVGEYSETNSKYVYGYELNVSNNTFTLEKKNSMQVPSRTQGITFLKDGKMVLSRSSQIYTWAKYYISRLEVYKPSKPSKTGSIKRNSLITAKTMPPMAEGIVSDGSYLYLAFESAVFSASNYPVDRICALKVSTITKKP